MPDSEAGASSRPATDAEQRALVGRYINYGCHESPADFESDHARDVRVRGWCDNCGREEQ